VLNTNEEMNFLKKRIKELEKQLDNLRLSRRVLMDLLEQIEKEKNILSAQLDKKSKQSPNRKQNPKKVYSQDFALLEMKDYIKK